MLKNKTKKNTFIKIFAFLMVFTVLLPQTTNAGITDWAGNKLNSILIGDKTCEYIKNGDYQLFSDIDPSFPAFAALGVSKNGDCVQVSGSLNRVFDAFFKILVGIASVMAIINIAYAGIKTMLAESGTVQKSEWKKTVVRSLEGLLIALVSWLILSTINDRTLKKGFKIPSDISQGIAEGRNASIQAVQQAQRDAEDLAKYRAVNINADQEGVGIGSDSLDGTTKIGNGVGTIFGYKDGDGTVGETGDNGIGNGSLSHVSGYTNYTGDPRSQGVALPRSEIIRLCGSVAAAANCGVEVHVQGKSLIVPIVDTSARNTDLSYGLVKNHLDSSITDSDSWSSKDVSVRAIPDYYKTNKRPQNPMIRDTPGLDKLSPAEIARRVNSGQIDVIMR